MLSTGLQEAQGKPKAAKPKSSAVGATQPKKAKAAPKAVPQKPTLNAYQVFVRRFAEQYKAGADRAGAEFNDKEMRQAAKSAWAGFGEELKAPFVKEAGVCHCSSCGCV